MKDSIPAYVLEHTSERGPSTKLTYERGQGGVCARGYPQRAWRSSKRLGRVRSCTSDRKRLVQSRVALEKAAELLDDRSTSRRTHASADSMKQSLRGIEHTDSESVRGEKSGSEGRGGECEPCAAKIL